MCRIVTGLYYLVMFGYTDPKRTQPPHCCTLFGLWTQRSHMSRDLILWPNVTLLWLFCDQMSRFCDQMSHFCDFWSHFWSHFCDFWSQNLSSSHMLFQDACNHVTNVTITWASVTNVTQCHVLRDIWSHKSRVMWLCHVTCSNITNYQNWMQFSLKGLGEWMNEWMNDLGVRAITSVAWTSPGYCTTAFNCFNMCPLYEYTIDLLI